MYPMTAQCRRIADSGGHHNAGDGVSLDIVGG
jgi:hypothetical protein